jgi:uncharacterized phiE125 gp8 family phage protein
MSALVTLTDVKSALNITRTANDAELTVFLAAAVSAIGQLVGPLAAQSVSEEIDSHGPHIVLTYTPVVSVQSVSIEPWLGAAPINDTTQWRLNPMTGVLRRLVVGGSLPYYGPGSIFTVTYTAGRTDIPDDLNRAVLMQVAAMWASQRGASPIPAGAEPMPPSYAGDQGFLGADVMALLVPYLRPPGLG